MTRLLEAIRGEYADRGFIEFGRVTEAELDELRACAIAAGWMHTTLPNGRAFFFDTQSTIADLRSRFTAKLRRNLRRDCRRLESRFAVDFEALEPSARSQHLEHLERFMDL
ncbi:MAG: hypothetical protein GY953_43645, partial [bacterium]|nr:hypothetical protein [bacterium]